MSMLIVHFGKMGRMRWDERSLNGRIEDVDL
jgi:hypothetical protein